jgi:hypothetical protein
MYSINFFFPHWVALGWGVALAQGLAGLTPGPALSPAMRFSNSFTIFSFCHQGEQYTLVQLLQQLWYGRNFYIHLDLVLEHGEILSSIHGTIPKG